MEVAQQKVYKKIDKEGTIRLYIVCSECDRKVIKRNMGIFGVCKSCEDKEWRENAKGGFV